jgi:serine/threonine protein kinase
MNIDENKLFASGDLEGKVIAGWTIVKKLAAPDKSKNETGGNFSTCYTVEKDGITAFMKVLDYEKIMKHKGPFTPQIMQQASTEFNYEKSLSEYCVNRKVSKVVHYVESGDEYLAGYIVNGSVSFIIYEMADGDIRRVLDLSSKAELAAKINTLSVKLKSLHDVSVGINQLHTNDVSHQDIKPSNILSFKGESKIGDLGRSLCFNSSVLCPYNKHFNGDRNYAAPECFFSDFVSNVGNLYQIDIYMFGGLVTYYITGLTFNALMNNYLPDILQFSKFRSIQLQPYCDVMPDMINAYQKALKDLENEIPIDDIKRGIVSLVSYLCNPDPTRRGHPKNVADYSRTPNYDLHRTIQELDVLQKKAELTLIKK